MAVVTIDPTQIGCWLDSHRGHYISRDVILLAKEWGFIIDPFAEFAINVYEDWDGDESYPFEAMMSLCDDAITWLNSGKPDCANCDGKGAYPKDGESWTHKDDPDKLPRCKQCSGSGRGDRVAGQNYPPIIPPDTSWSFNDGDFGLYLIEDLSD
jgi:hypothetical protein